MSSTDAWLHSLHKTNPEFKRLTADFLTILDAKEALEQRMPDNHARVFACEYLANSARAIFRNAGIPEVFMQACIKNRPPR